ncbi:MAG: ABC transporter ATP-binding protein/permease [Verrucomicrobia bacterium]|jgi:ATP-binding cassette subfamily B protein/subfamily B ATP-binding cassette protein MsbA|nr:ABC transporter ATP-binding protein/permease [Verrucomicrobiota bacterium]
MSIYLRTLRYFRAFISQTVLAVALMSLGIGFNLLAPWPFKYVVDGILQGKNAAGVATAHAFIAQWFSWTSEKGAALTLFVIMALIALFSGLVNLLSNTLLIKIGLKALLHLRTQLYSCLQALPLQFHDARRSSDSSFRVAYDSQSIQTIYNKGFATIFGAVVTLIGALVIMFRMNSQLTLVSMAVIPPLYWAIQYYGERIRRESTTIQERESDLLATTQEGLGSIRMVQAFGRESFEVDQFVRHATRSLEANFRLNMTSMKSALIVTTLIAVGTSAMYYVGTVQVLDGRLSIGDLTVFVAYLATLYQPIQQLTYTAWALEGAAAGAQRCFEVLDREEETKDAVGAIPLGVAKGEITFAGVTFAYDPKAPVLAGVDLAVAPGETVAFVGGTGAGKSTLMSLVPRFYDPTAGIVRIDGHDLKSLTKASLRSQIGMVLQDTVLFSSSIRENIAYGREGATEEDIIEAAKRAQAHDFIMAQPQSYETPVGERGGHLSVGQRQRIGIARAFLKNAPILLLDEPTSALDPSTEKAIMETIAELMKGRTTIIITHRLSTVHHLGRVVLLENGRIAEQGTGPELLAAGGSYARLYHAAGHEPKPANS